MKLLKVLYPICNCSFELWLNSNVNYLSIYNSIGQPKAFDVTLRDGLQSINKDQIESYTTKIKLMLYNLIIKKYKPIGIEIGSIVSPKVLPIFSDTIELFNISENYDSKYILIPNHSKLEKIKDIGCYNISVITSVSNSFQMLNTKKNINTNKKEIIEIINKLNLEKIQKPKVKLYISCIDSCPIEGHISHKFIIDEIKYYYDTCKPDKICLSDTCGNLLNENFIKIVDGAYSIGVPYEKISLHLHVDYNNITNTQQIIFSALDRKINEFDVSLLESGGCSVTMGSNTRPNLGYDLFYKSIVDYILLKNN